MSLTSVAFKDPFVREYARRISMGEVQPPAQLAGMFAGNGYFDPSQMDALYAAINQYDPQGSASVRSRVGDVRDADTSALGANDQLTWKSAADENDWFAPVSMLTGVAAGGYLNGAFSGLGGGLEGAVGGLDISGGLDGLTAAGDASWGVNPAPMYDEATGALIGESNLGGAFPEYANVATGGPSTPGWGIPTPTGSFRNPDGSYGSTAANSAIGGAGVAAAQGASQGNTPWMDDPSTLAKIAATLGMSPDVLKMLGSAFPGLMGAYASSKQSDTLAGLAKEYAAYGAPSRARYEASFAPGFSMAQDPGYQDALDASSKATMRSMSVNGNPAGSPNAWAATMKDSYDRTAYPALQQYRNQNAATSGIANFNAAAPGVQTGQVQANANIWNGIGSAIGNVTNPAPTLAEIMKMYGGGGGNDIFKVGP